MPSFQLSPPLKWKNTGFHLNHSNDLHSYSVTFPIAVDGSAESQKKDAVNDKNNELSDDTVRSNVCSLSKFHVQRWGTTTHVWIKRTKGLSTKGISPFLEKLSKAHRYVA